MGTVLALLGISGTAAGLATNVVLLVRLLRGQADVQVKVNGHLGWYIDRIEQLHEELAAWGITPAPPATPPPTGGGDTIAA